MTKHGSALKVQFNEVLTRILQARQKAFQQVNVALIELYWNVGKYMSLQVSRQNWGKAVVAELAVFIKESEPNIKGFSARNLWRMKQFYETYQQHKKLPTLWTELSWSHHRRIMSLKLAEERAFYLHLCGQRKYSVRELDRDVKLPHENPSIGVLLCREKNDEVVEYALSRSLSPTIFSDYETQLIPKEVLRQKLNEFYALLETSQDD